MRRLKEMFTDPYYSLFEKIQIITGCVLSFIFAFLVAIGFVFLVYFNWGICVLAAGVFLAGYLIARFIDFMQF